MWSNFSLAALLFVIICCWTCMWNPVAGNSGNNDAIRFFLPFQPKLRGYNQSVTLKMGGWWDARRRREQEGQVFSPEGNGSYLLHRLGHLERESRERSGHLAFTAYTQEKEERARKKTRVRVCVCGGGGISFHARNVLDLRQDKEERKRAPLSRGPVPNSSD